MQKEEQREEEIRTAAKKVAVERLNKEKHGEEPKRDGVTGKIRRSKHERLSKQAHVATENAKKALKKSKKHRAKHLPSKETERAAEEDDLQTEELDIKPTAEKADRAAHDLQNNRPYEPEWGHNSGNSYNNGPIDHFYHGDASPYSVTKEDVQVSDWHGHAIPAAGQADIQLSANIDAENQPLGSFLLLQNSTLGQPAKPQAITALLSGQPRKPTISLIQSGVEQFGVTQDLLQKNVRLFDIKGKVLSENKFKSAATSIPTVDSMLDEDQGVTMFEKEIGSHYGGLY